MGEHRSRRKIFESFSIDDWWRPSNANGRYVFLNSLSEDDPNLYKSAEARLQFDVSDKYMDVRMANALSLLEAIMANERAKEKNYIMEIQQKFPKLFGSSTDWEGINIVRKINEAILGVDAFERIGRYEMERIKQNRDYRIFEEEHKDDKKKAKNPFPYHKSYSQALTSYSDSLVSALTGHGGMQDKGVKIYEQIFKALGDSVKLMSAKEIIVTANILNASALQMLYGDASDDISIENFMKNPAFSNYLNSIQRAYQAYQAGDKILWQTYQKQTRQAFDYLGYKTLSKKKKKERIDTTILNKFGQANANLQNLSRSKKNDIAKITFQMEGFYGRSAELLAQLGQSIDIQGAVIAQSQNTGKTGTTTDVITTMDFSARVGVEMPEMRQRDEEFQKLIQDSQKWSREAWREQNDRYQQFYDDVEQQFKDQREELNKIQKSFILHNNIKDYSTYKELGYASSFSGGTDWTVANFNTFLSSLGSFFSKKDLEFIDFLIINCVPEAIGKRNQTALTKYLSIFASMMLFSDGATMAVEVARQMSADQSTLNVLHLYFVNGIYVPSSYVMEMLIKQLTSLQQKSSLTSNAVKLKINGGIKDTKAELKNLTRERIFGESRWNTFMEREVASIHLSLNFLGGFLDILDNLFGA